MVRMDTQVCIYWGVGDCWEEMHMLEANNHLEVHALTGHHDF